MVHLILWIPASLEVFVSAGMTGSHLFNRVISAHPPGQGDGPGLVEPLSQVIVFCSPPPVLIAEAVNLPKVPFVYQENTPEIKRVELILKLRTMGGQMRRHDGIGVIAGCGFWQQVDIMKAEIGTPVPVKAETHIHQFGPIKQATS